MVTPITTNKYYASTARQYKTKTAGTATNIKSPGRIHTLASRQIHLGGQLEALKVIKDKYAQLALNAAGDFFLAQKRLPTMVIDSQGDVQAFDIGNSGQAILNRYYGDFFAYLFLETELKGDEALRKMTFTTPKADDAENENNIWFQEQFACYMHYATRHDIVAKFIAMFESLKTEAQRTYTIPTKWSEQSIINLINQSRPGLIKVIDIYPEQVSTDTTKKKSPKANKPQYSIWLDTRETQTILGLVWRGNHGHD